MLSWLWVYVPKGAFLSRRNIKERIGHKYFETNKYKAPGLFLIVNKSEGTFLCLGMSSNYLVIDPDDFKERQDNTMTKEESSSPQSHNYWICLQPEDSSRMAQKVPNYGIKFT